MMVTKFKGIVMPLYVVGIIYIVALVASVVLLIYNYKKLSKFFMFLFCFLGAWQMAALLYPKSVQSQEYYQVKYKTLKNGAMIQVFDQDDEEQNVTALLRQIAPAGYRVRRTIYNKVYLGIDISRGGDVKDTYEIVKGQ